MSSPKEDRDIELIGDALKRAPLSFLPVNNEDLVEGKHYMVSLSNHNGSGVYYCSGLYQGNGMFAQPMVSDIEDDNGISFYFAGDAYQIPGGLGN
jgi:hypothetical protein